MAAKDFKVQVVALSKNHSSYTSCFKRKCFVIVAFD
jgi:hypothetical protein